MLALAAFSFTAAMAQSGLDKTALQMAQEMMPGWNLGNTMEAGVTWGSSPAATFNNNSGLAGETAWQSTKTTQEIINYVKAQGFRSVRIPCAWVWGHISNANTYAIDATWMARVRQVVDYCINAGLYVVLNDHWDGGWLEEHINATGATKTKNKEVLTAIWTQIANEFKDYDEHLVFAGLTPCVPRAATTPNECSWCRAQAPTWRRPATGWPTRCPTTPSATNWP